MLKVVRLSLISTLLLSASSLSAQDLYRWTDEAGITHYSTVKPNTSAQPAKLPEIAKAKFKLSDFGAAKSCSKHAGINCAAGPDEDGSVICYDGFKDATARYKFSCSSAKLVVSELLPPSNPLQPLKVFVRNSSSVAAKNSKAYLYLGGGERIALKGPNEIEPFGIAEYSFIPSSPLPKLSTGNVTLSCLNCD